MYINRNKVKIEISVYFCLEYRHTLDGNILEKEYTYLKIYSKQK